jgi:hypothetical protein
MDAYIDYATAHTAIELIDDTKIVAIFPFSAHGQKEVIVVIKKGA